MNQDFFTTLPSHIVIDILSRLPIPTILRCKCVCKSWPDLLDSHEFVNYHLSISVPGLAFMKQGYPKYDPSKLYKIYNFNDDEHDFLHYDLVTSFEPPFPGSLLASANGLLLFKDFYYCDGLFVCNPVTREYMELHLNPHQNATLRKAKFGFGVSRVKGQHKVVRLFHEETSDHKMLQTECQVYTLGSGTWRSITPTDDPLSRTNYLGDVVFFNGNLHWPIYDSRGSCAGIYCFDLETERFSVLSPPDDDDEQTSFGNVCALGDFLGVCYMLFDHNDDDHEIVIWLMKEYGVENSWSKEYVIKMKPMDDPFDVYANPIKVHKDGDILMAWGDSYLFYFSSKTTTCAVIDMFRAHRFGHMESVLHTSSFISLKSFLVEKVFTF